MALTAAAATLLAAIPLSTIFSSFTWLFYCAFGIAVVTGTAMLVRSARGPVWAQVLAMMAALLLYLTWVFPSGEELLRVLPTPETFRHFNDLLVSAGTQMRTEAAPVPDLDGLLLLTTLGVGLVAVLVDLAAVGLRRPALAGLPMLAIYSVPVAVLPDNLALWPFAFSAAGFLWLLVSDSVDRVRRFGRRFTGEGRDVDVWEPSPLAAAGRRLGVVGVVVAMLLPFLVPGLGTSLLSGFGGSGGLVGNGGPGRGQGQVVDLSALLSDQLVRDQVTNMVRVTTTDPAPFYLRFGVADQISKNGFVSRPSSNGVGVEDGLPDYSAPSAPGVSSQRYQAQVEVLSFNMPLAPAYQQLVSVRGLDRNWLFDTTTNLLYGTGNATTGGKKYTIDFIRVGFSPTALRTAPAIAGNDPVMALTQVAQVQQVTDLVRGLTQGKITEYDQVRAIYDYFGEGFTYTFSTQQGPTNNPIVNFLTNKKGFCVQYAAAMAWLVRVAGYPARVAFGFTRGNGRVGGSYTLTNFNLHAWTEVYFPTFGWVPFDATPTASIVGSVPTSWAPDPSDPNSGTDAPPELPKASGGPDESASAGPVDVPGANGGGGTGPIPIDSRWLITAAVIAGLAALLFAPAMRRRSLRRTRRVRGDRTIVLDTGPAGEAVGPTPGLVIDSGGMAAARRDAHAAWAELLDLMVDYGVDVDPAETPRTTADRVGRLAGVEHRTQEPVELLARAEERARYALTPLRPRGFDQAVRAIQAALASRVGRWQRISAVLLPRSVLLRWQSAWIGWLGQTMTRLSRAREAMAALSPRRIFVRG
jgi:transglutaminase-like putative cysteine protease